MKIVGLILTGFVLAIVLVGFTEPMWRKWFKKPKQNATEPGESVENPDGTEIPDDNTVKENEVTEQ